MKDVIKELRRQAASCNPKNQDRYEIEILLKSEQASQIADALDVATYPPIVRAVLAVLKCNNTDGYKWREYLKAGLYKFLKTSHFIGILKVSGGGKMF